MLRADGNEEPCLRPEGAPAQTGGGPGYPRSRGTVIGLGWQDLELGPQRQRVQKEVVAELSLLHWPCNTGGLAATLA